MFFSYLCYSWFFSDTRKPVLLRFFYDIDASELKLSLIDELQRDGIVHLIQMRHTRVLAPLQLNITMDPSSQLVIFFYCSIINDEHNSIPRQPHTQVLRASYMSICPNHCGCFYRTVALLTSKRKNGPFRIISEFTDKCITSFVLVARGVNGIVLR